MVDTTGPLNTALHSWGSVRIVHVDVEDLSVTRDCSKVCKGHWSMSLGKNHVQISGISPQKKWLRFVGFQWNKGGNPEPPQQLLMAGISQVASPSQAAWIFAHIRSHLGDMKYWGISVHKPRHILACVCMELFELRDKWCGGYMSVAMDLFRNPLKNFFLQTVCQWMIRRPRIQQLRRGPIEQKPIGHTHCMPGQLQVKSEATHVPPTRFQAMPLQQVQAVEGPSQVDAESSKKRPLEVASSELHSDHLNKHHTQHGFAGTSGVPCEILSSYAANASAKLQGTESAQIQLSIHEKAVSDLTEGHASDRHPEFRPASVHEITEAEPSSASFKDFTLPASLEWTTRKSGQKILYQLVCPHTI